MKIETLNEQIKNRAKEMTQKAIMDFKSSLDVAFATLGHDCGVHIYDRTFRSGNRIDKDELVGKMLDALATNCSLWPKELFEGSRNKLTKEILDTMDVVQRTLVAQEPDPDGPQCEEPPQ